MPTTVFTATHSLTLGMAIDTGARLSWDLTIAFDDPHTVTDQNDNGNLDIGSDYAGSSALYTGYVVTIGGLDYGVFRISSNYFISYDQSLNDISTMLTGPGSTTTITDNATLANCFVAGTRIKTPYGETPIEDLQIGDLVSLANGGSAPIRWRAQQRVPSFPWRSAKLDPVRINAGALGNGLPHSDLTVSANHGMILHNLVVNAAALVNGSSIRFVSATEWPDAIAYYHIELDQHDVLLANGAATESFCDHAGRSGFDNYAEYQNRFKADRIIPHMPLLRIPAARLLPDYARPCPDLQTKGYPDLCQQPLGSSGQG